jgi:hypothetical protein
MELNIHKVLFPRKSGPGELPITPSRQRGRFGYDAFRGSLAVAIVSRIIRCLFFLALGAAAGCNLCKEEVWNSVTSPDGRWKATTIMRDCGATTSEVVSVNVSRTGNKAFQADHNALVMNHGIAPRLAWRGNDTLVLDCDRCDSKDEFERRTQIGPIHIEFRMPYGETRSRPEPSGIPNACEVGLSVSSRSDRLVKT